MKARLTSAIAAAAMIIPIAAVAVTPALASTTRHQLTIRVVDRSGHHVAPLDVQVLNIGTGVGIDMGSSTHRLLRPGRYNVAAWITTGIAPSQSYTLADQVVGLNRNRTVVFDARQGRKVRLSLNDPSAQAELLEIAPIIGGFWAFNPTTVSPPAGNTYVIPMSSALMTLYAYSVWEKEGNTVTNPSPLRYDILRIFHGGIPRRPVITTRRSQLARIDLTVRATDANQQATLELSPMGSVPVPLNAETTLGATPARLTSYRTPGFRWQPIVSWQSPAGSFRDDDVNQGPYGPGRHSELWGAAVLAPGQNCMFGQLQGRSLTTGMTGSCFPIGDPLHPSDEGSGERQLLQLFSGSRLLAHTRNDQITVRIPNGSRRYKLSLNATRATGSLLSTQVSGIWRFNATGSARQFGTPIQILDFQLVPAGTNARNQAAAGSLTKVPLRIFDDNDVSVLLPAVRAWASSNDGKTWRQVAVHRDGGHYVVSVRNSTSAGFTSLRVSASDHHGNSEELTVIHAYAVR